MFALHLLFALLALLNTPQATEKPEKQMYASSTAIAGFLLCHQSSLLITFHVNKLSLFSKSVCSTSSLVTRPQNFHCTPTPFKMTSYQFQLLNIISQESPLRDTTGASSVVVHGMDGGDDLSHCLDQENKLKSIAKSGFFSFL